MSGRGREAIDLTGQRFGRLVVVRRATWVAYRGRHAAWLCFCDCGRSAICRGANLREGGYLSCGCLRREVSRARALAYKRAGCNQFGVLSVRNDWREARRRLRAAGHEVKQFEGTVYVDGRRSDDPLLRADGYDDRRVRLLAADAAVADIQPVALLAARASVAADRDARLHLRASHPAGPGNLRMADRPS